MQFSFLCCCCLLFFFIIDIALVCLLFLFLLLLWALLLSPDNNYRNINSNNNLWPTTFVMILSQKAGNKNATHLLPSPAPCVCLCVCVNCCCKRWAIVVAAATAAVAVAAGSDAKLKRKRKRPSCQLALYTLLLPSEPRCKQKRTCTMCVPHDSVCPSVCVCARVSVCAIQKATKRANNNINTTPPPCTVSLTPHCTLSLYESSVIISGFIKKLHRQYPLSERSYQSNQIRI